MTRANQILAALISIALVTSVGLAVTGGFAGAQTQEDGMGTASVSISDQPSDGQTVIVDNVTLPEGGFVVIHDAEELDDGDAVGSVIGVSSYLEAGTHEDVPVTMAQELDTTEVEVTAMPHMDTNGNQVYDFVTSDGAVDGPYTTSAAEETETETEEMTETETEMTETETEEMTETAASDFQEETETETEMTETETEAATTTEEMTTTEEAAGGEIVVDTATIDAVGDGAPSTNLEVSDQSSNGTTVTVDRVTLYRGGYVVIHDTEELEEGDAVGSVIGQSEYMAPGTYEDVQITLAESVEFEDGEDVNVTAMPHHETNENLVYDFVVSEGATDGPYTVNDTDEAVTASITLSEEGGETTETEEMTETETEEMTETETEEMTETETEMVGTETTTAGT